MYLKMKFSITQRKIFQIFLLIVVLTGCGAHVHHQVRPGESLYAIGWRYSQDYRDIARWNHLNSPYLIKPGQWLRVAPPNKPWWADQYPESIENQEASYARKTSEPEINTSSVTSSSEAVSVSVITDVPKITSSEKPDPGLPEAWFWPVDKTLNAQKNENSQYKKGVIFPGSVGKSVFASASGEVVYRGSGLLGYGKLIIIKHNKTYLSAYANNENILVGEGDRVKIGQQIATMGQTPEGEALLYFEIRKNGKPVDPVRYLKTPAAR